MYICDSTVLNSSSNETRVIQNLQRKWKHAFLFSSPPPPPPKILPLVSKVWKYVDPCKSQLTIQDGACRITRARIQTHTRNSNTYCLSTATRARFSVTLYVHCLVYREIVGSRFFLDICTCLWNSRKVASWNIMVKISWNVGNDMQSRFSTTCLYRSYCVDICKVYLMLLCTAFAWLWFTNIESW
jgi:hypothetical protein